MGRGDLCRQEPGPDRLTRPEDSCIPRWWCAHRSQEPRPDRTRPEVPEVPHWLCSQTCLYIAQPQASSPCACTPPLGRPGAEQAVH